MDISLRRLAVAADVSSACSVLHSYLPACPPDRQIRPWHTEELNTERLAGRKPTELSVENITEKLRLFQGISDSCKKRVADEI